MLYHIKKFLYLISYINDIINFGVNNTKQNNISPDGDTMAGKTTTIKELLKAAMLPLGSTLYVYGGAWNEADTGAGEEAMTFGVSPEWKKFYDSKDETYDFDKFRFQVHEGIHIYFDDNKEELIEKNCVYYDDNILFLMIYVFQTTHSPYVPQTSKKHI